MKIKFLLFSLLAAFSVKAQLPETDIFISRINMQNGKMGFSKPENITHRKGYDNQPFFLPDGKGLLFVVVPDTTQADIFRYDFATRKITPVTNTAESEYSPMLTPDGRNISVVRVDADTGQRFYELPLKDVKSAHALRGTDSIGYYCWLNDTSLAMFILGDAMTLQVLDIPGGERTLVASDIGRCMKISRDGRSLYFVIKQNENEWSIFSMDIATKKLNRVMATLPGSEDFAVMPDGTFLMGKDGKLFRSNPSAGNAWEEAADFSADLGDFYRISVNAQGDRIAMVAFTGKKP